MTPQVTGVLAARGSRPEDGDGSVQPAPVSVRECPASFAQRRLWFFEQIESGTSVLHNSFTTSMTGTLDVAALERAFDEVQRRHDTLRTSFSDRGGEPVQVIAAPREIRLPVRDLRTVPADDRQRAAERLIADTRVERFDLARGPLWRALLIQTRDDHWKLLVVVHHLVTDGQSTAIFQRELAALYLAFSTNRPNPLPPLVMQYGEFAARQRQAQDEASQSANLAYWTDRLRGAPPVLDLPTDFPRAAAQTFSGASVRRTVDLARMRELEGLGRRNGATLFMVLLAGFSALLSRWSGQSDVVVGTPVAGRLHADVEPLIGLFINTLPLRVDVSGDPTFQELLMRVKATAFDALDRRDVPFERIVEAVQPQRARSHTPLFQVLFNMQELGGSGSATLGGVLVEPDELPAPPSKFDLTVYANRRPHGIELVLVYNPNLFDEARIEEMAAQYEQLLHDAVTDPQRQIATIDLRTPEARLQLPDPSRPLPESAAGSIVERLRLHASSNPDRVAVSSPEGDWTYADLDRRSDTLAATLRDRGIGAGDVVAIHAHRSPGLVVALLGVLKSGGAFTILDPRHPPARLVACVRAAGPAAFIQMTRAGALAADLEREVDGIGAIEIGDDYGIGATASAPSGALDPDRLAYVAFTSGSTGGVKAIAGSERPLTHFLEWQRQTFGLTSADAFSVLSGLAHDPLLRDVLAPLWVGGRIEMPPDVDLRDADTIASWFAERGISVAHLTPAMARLLSDAAARAALRFPALRRAFFAGETLTGTVVQGVRAVAPDAECVNCYGATETPQVMGFWRVPSPAPATVALGRGIEGVQLLVLAANGQMAGVGEPGEICIRTPYLSQGYRGDDALTRERFMQSPFSANARDRVYRTGDVGRYRADGCVEFVGRLDTQVKIRGFRIELGEIDAALTAHPAVAIAAVVAKDAGDGQRRLAAFVSLRVDQAAGVRELLSWTRGRVPDYMVPETVTLLPRIPLTASGKINRLALLDMTEQVMEPCEGPAGVLLTETERILGGLWVDVLRVPAVGRDDGFFDLGGHSLRATQLVSRIRDRFNADLSLRQIFDTPRLRDLATAVDAAVARCLPSSELSGDRVELEF